MSGTITLTDTIEFHVSNVAMSAVQRAVADRIPNSSAKMKRWLLDLSGRCAPFASFDVRGLPENDRITLLEAIHKTTEEEERDGSELFAMLREIGSLIEDAKKEFPEYPNIPFSGRMEDLDQIWGTEDADIGTSMDRVMNDLHEGRARLLTVDEWMSEPKRQRRE